MDLYEDEAREAYLKGRLLGLNDLIQVLKEALSKSSGENAISRTIVEHISNEVEDLLTELKATLPDKELKKIEKIEQKHEEFREAIEEKKEQGEAPLTKDEVKKADELMKRLLDLKPEQ